MTQSPNPMADVLRGLLGSPEILQMPCCYDALSAKLVQQAGSPLTLLSAAMKSMLDVLGDLKQGRDYSGALLDFADLRQRVGFDDYHKAAERFDRKSDG